MEKLVLGDYEELLASHVAKLEEYVVHRLVLLRNQNANLDKVRSSRRNLEQSLLSEIGRLSADIDRLCLESEPEVDLKTLEHRKEEHENDVQLLLRILEKVYHRERKTEERLQRALEKTRKEKWSIEASSLTTADARKIQVWCETAKQMLEECVSKKQIQQSYVERLRADILLAERKTNELSLILGQKRGHVALPNYVELRKAIEKLRTVQNCGIHSWDDCLKASIKEESAESLMEDEHLLLDEKKVERVRSFIIGREENIYIERVVQNLRSNLQELENCSEEVQTYNTILADRFLNAQETFQSKLFHLVSHADGVQQDIFNAEIKTEIQNVLSPIIQKCLASHSELQLHDLNQSPVNALVENMFPLDNRALAVLELCDKKQRLIFEFSRTRAALLFKNSRIKVELETSITAVGEILHKRDQLESEINTIDISSVETPKEKNVQRDPEDEKIREQMQSNLIKTVMDIEQIKGEITLLTSGLDQILMSCEALGKKVQKLKPFSNYKSNNDEINSLMKELNSIVSKQHEIITDCTAIQKELKFIVSRRDCAVNNFLGYLSNLDQVDNEYPKLELLRGQVDELRKAVQDAKSKLLKKTHKL